jgi:preprotein translocase subunit SecB
MSSRKNKNIDQEVYRKLLINLNIDAINLTSLVINNVNYPNNPNVKVIVKLAPKILSIKDNILDILCNFNVSAVIDKENDDVHKNDEFVFKMKFDFVIKYSIDALETFSEEYIEFFIKNNVPINIWPYARELVSSITTRMGFPVLVIAPYKKI